MVRHKPINTTAAVILTAHSPSFTAPIVFTTSYTDQALTSLTTTSIRWGSVLLSVSNESTPVIFASPV